MCKVKQRKRQRRYLKPIDMQKLLKQDLKKRRKTIENSAHKIFENLNLKSEKDEEKFTTNSTIKPEETENFEEEEPEVDNPLDKIRHICPFCQKTLSSAKNVERHVTKKHRKGLNCDKCNRKCHTMEILESHKLISDPNCIFKCQTCQSKYLSWEALKRHEIRTHNNGESFICEHCGKNFKLKFELTHHIKRTHMSDLHVCRFCGKKVKDVKTHEWQHRKRNREIKFDHKCEICGSIFRHKNSLDNHLLTHEIGFKCNECEQVFIKSSQLQYHKRMRHRPANFCKICKKVFSSKSNNFYQHVLTHAGVRPYKCDICGEDFTQRSSMLRHRKGHPGPLPEFDAPVAIADIARKILEKHSDTKN